ncbi:FAD-dependent oxidoreductase [Paraglaciecola aquimarina]|uniref:FAD-dependent oxidoreductase n=1 Tax=Paraglaciecola aquimarina TaxID=1235557 RepID=A0ABU3SXM1_9ALTE|nr:FAD-dependent oxidoreductase [Paraglaciecola aquimarina]MDU0354754.1 FAD-dependent oxidoreductase [Paraglaciecola aquimarina]
MHQEKFSKSTRTNKQVALHTDVVVVGGGLAGVCAAIASARSGAKVVLVQDRPVLGGNASSEVRLWALGATSHMGNNNRWSREGGLIDEIMLENLRANKEGNPLIFDAILLDKVVAETNITMLLNTAAYSVTKESANRIESVNAFCSQNSTYYSIFAPIFTDCSGDGIVAFNAGAAFRIGSEDKYEFNELLAPEKANSDLLGHSLFFYSKDAGTPVEYKAPAFAYSQDEIDAIPRSKNIGAKDSGCKFWWLEFGGILDTVHDTEEIKWELWKIVYGIWDYIKNSGKYEDVENLTLEWVGTVPGKRESRRFEGEYMITQHDIVEQKRFDDAISYGGWAIDLHPAEGVYSEKPACSQYHSKGVYQIPYRCFLSRDIENLYLGGRIISATHMAFGSTRVMITCAHGGQAIGEAAAMCAKLNVKPKALLAPKLMSELQNRLNGLGHGLAGIPLTKSDVLLKAEIQASSTLALAEFSQQDDWLSLAQSAAQLLPFTAGLAPTFTVQLSAQEATTLTCQLRVSIKPENYTPDLICKTIELDLHAGEQTVSLDFSEVELITQYGFVIFLANDKVQVRTSAQRVTGTMSVFNKVHKAVSNNGKQIAPPNSGVEEFEFWTPERRPMGQNIAMQITPALQSFAVSNLTNGHLRPWLGSNAWVADLSDKAPTLTLSWPEKQTLAGLRLYFDTDSDHALETVLMVHPEKRIPFCVSRYSIKLEDGTVLMTEGDNYQTLNTIYFKQTISTDKLIIELSHPAENVPASVFDIEVF